MEATMEATPHTETEIHCRACRLVIPKGPPEATLPQFCEACTLKLKGGNEKASLVTQDCGHQSILHASQHNKSKQICYHPLCASKSNFSQTEEDDCVFCTERLVSQGCVSLTCGHLFHRDCLETSLELIFDTPLTEPVDLSSSFCPFCKSEIAVAARGYTSIETAIEKAKDIRTHIEKLTHGYLMAENGGNGMPSNVLEHGIKHFNFYKCEKCESIYCGGKRECGEAPLLPGTKMLCKGCRGCNRHDEDFLSFKCRFCCKEAVWFCYGHTHFCEECHENEEYTTGENLEYIVSEIPQCPGREKCPLGLIHPPHGEEFSWCHACIAEDQLTHLEFGEELENVFTTKSENKVEGDSPENAKEGPTENAKESAPENKKENAPENAKEDPTENTKKDPPENSPENSRENVPENTKQNPPENTPVHTENTTPENIEDENREKEKHDTNNELDKSATEIITETPNTPEGIHPTLDQNQTITQEYTNNEEKDENTDNKHTNKGIKDEENNAQKDANSTPEDYNQKDRKKPNFDDLGGNKENIENEADLVPVEPAPNRKVNRKRGRKWR
eukprot:Phypoly_transcript_05481.p1 GENE.Phypoly_transcript_05481~~Phypoly_transcript_05481.p1  ORF type:complete len:561 (+),score=109.04 Phypoly_transcript_05481:70-1752(+)